MFDVKKYWDRIGFSPLPEETPEAQLKRVHRCQCTSIAFEDISSFCHREVSLDREKLFDKIINHPRGGYCFELNGLFGHLLDAMGYNVTPVICRIITPAGEIRPLSHRINLVRLEGKTWICDVGYGAGGWIEPVLLFPGLPQEIGGDIYTVQPMENGWYRVDWQHGESSRCVLMFPLAAAIPEDFEISSYFQARSENSTFVKNLMCRRPFEGGAVSIMNNRFKMDRDGEIATEVLTSDNVAEILKTHFFVELPDDLLSELKTALDRMNAAE